MLVRGVERVARAGQPRAIVRRPVDRQHHRRQQRRLRARQVVRAVRVQDAAVVAHLVDEVVDHVAREGDLVVAQQPQDDEVAVPAVHLVEAAAGHDVGAGQVQQAGLADRCARVIDGQRAQVDAGQIGRGERLGQRGRDGAAILVGGDVHRPGRARRVRDLVVRGGARQVGERPRERLPRIADVRAQAGDARRGERVACGVARTRARRRGFRRRRGAGGERRHQDDRGAERGCAAGGRVDHARRAEPSQRVRTAAALLLARASAWRDSARSGLCASVTVASDSRSRRK